MRVLRVPWRYSALFVTLFCFGPASSVFAVPQGIPTGQITVSEAALANSMVSTSVDVYIKGPNGEPVQGQVIVTLIKLGGEVFDQRTTKNGATSFGGVPQNEYTVSVVSPKYQSISKRIDVTDNRPARLTIQLEALADAEDSASSVGLMALPGKIQKEVGKALGDLRANKPSGALSHLQAAQRGAPTSADVEYLFSIYATESKDPVQAKAHWMKTLELNSRHVGALMALGQSLLQGNKPAEALPYLTRAVEAEPDSWRAQALLSEACVLQGMNDEADKHAQRAIDLGHERAAAAQLVLARVLVQKGEVEQAVGKLEAYVKSHPADKDTAEYLGRLKNPSAAAPTSASELGVKATSAEALPVPSNWLPPDVDASVPAVESGAACAVGDVVKKAGQRLVELTSDVDRFTATESLMHEAINKYGLPSQPERRKFNYVVSIQEIQGRYLNVEEYRDANGSPEEFPGGVATNGLPALVLIFHPFNAPNFEMSCEGLARTGNGLAWQVHFRQRPDKPNTVRRYRVGVDGPSYAVALKGRAWISADTDQILRLETDLVAPVPQIQLVAEHTAIEYGPVKFRGGQVNMWLPQSADVYYDWRGRKTHRRHSFGNYMLFGVDERQKISAPKVDDTGGNGPTGEPKAPR